MWVVQNEDARSSFFLSRQEDGFGGEDEIEPVDECGFHVASSSKKGGPCRVSSEQHSGRCEMVDCKEFEHDVVFHGVVGGDDAAVARRERGQVMKEHGGLVWERSLRARIGLGEQSSHGSMCVMAKMFLNASECK